MDSIKLQYLSQPELKSFQEAKMAEILAYVSVGSPYYKELFTKEKIDVTKIRCIEDLRDLPVTTKQDLQERNLDFLCVSPLEIRDYVTTSGTLGEPVTFACTYNDLLRLGVSEMLSYEFAGCKPGDVIQLMCTIDRCFMAGHACLLGSLDYRTGIIRAGNGVPELQWNTIRRLNPTTVVCVPSFILKLVDFAQTHDIEYRRSSLRHVICCGEAIRNGEKELNILGTKVREAWPELSLHGNYASTEMQSSFSECEAECGHHHKPDLTIVEFLDENNCPVAEGEAGEVTITTLGVEGMPLIRFKTGDVCRHYDEPCSCGRNTRRLGPIIGRKGQMIKYKGTTLYPAALYDILDNIPDIVNYIVEVYINQLGTDGIRILIGTNKPSEMFIRQIKDVFRSKIRVAPEVVFEPIELIVRKQTPPTSRKIIKFFDYRN
jgi:phenylacetate-CoA ligase